MFREVTITIYRIFPNISQKTTRRKQEKFGSLLETIYGDCLQLLDHVQIDVDALIADILVEHRILEELEETSVRWE